MAKQQLIGAVGGLEEGGKGLRFDLRQTNDDIVPAFAIRFDYQYFAYLNICGHIALQLDYMPGDFFGDDGQTLICATHGAEFAPDTGACLGGPCNGVGLHSLQISEADGNLYLLDDNYTVVVKETSREE